MDPCVCLSVALIVGKNIGRKQGLEVEDFRQHCCDARRVLNGAVTSSKLEFLGQDVWFGRD